MRIVEYIVGIFIVILLLGPFFRQSEAARTDTYVQTAPTVVTAGAVFDADVTLLKELWDGDLVNVDTVTSNDTDDVPAVNTYAAGSKTLNIIGLAESTTRTLTITYSYGSLDTTTDTVVDFFRIFISLVVLVLIVAGMVTDVRKAVRK